MSSRAFTLFDEVFEDNLYRIAHLGTGTQPYAKIEGLKRLVVELESDISELVKSLTTLDALTGFRAASLKKINSGLARKIVHPFIPDQLIDQRFTALTTAVEAFRFHEGPTIIERYHEIASALDDYIQLASAMSTKYADEFCAGIARQLRVLTDAVFESTHFSKPATLVVMASEKKYALGFSGASFDVFVDMLNSGPGFAFGVDIEITAHTDNISILKPKLHLGGIEPSRISVAIPVQVQQCSDSALIEVHWNWQNFDATVERASATFQFPGQRGDIDWEKAKREDPYSLAAVSMVDQLVGARIF